MRINTAIIILIVALAILMAEITLYYVVGIFAVSSGSGLSLPVFTAVFAWIMIMTVTVGVVSLIAALIERLAKKENLSWYILPPIVVLVGLGTGAYLLIGLLR